MDILSRWAPFLYFGQNFRLGAANKVIRDRWWGTCHALWLVLDGSINVVEPDGTRHIVRSPNVFHADPGTTISSSNCAAAVRVVFDLVPRARIRARGLMRPDDPQLQPSWEALTGARMPMPLPEALQVEATRTVRHLALLRPYSTIAVMTESAALATFLARLVDATAADIDRGMPSGEPTNFAARLEVLLMSRAYTGGTVEEAARMLGISARHCVRAYRDARGETPGKFLQRFRIERAQQLLAQGRGIAESARAVGFAQDSGLRACFRRIAGTSPTQWLAEHDRRGSSVTPDD